MFSHDHKMKEGRHVKNGVLLMLLVIAIFVNNRSLQVISSAGLPIHNEVGAIAVPSSVPICTSRWCCKYVQISTNKGTSEI